MNSILATQIMLNGDTVNLLSLSYDLGKAKTYAKASIKLSAVFFSTKVRARFSLSSAPTMNATSTERPSVRIRNRHSDKSLLPGTWNHTLRAKVRALQMIVDQYLRPSLYLSNEEEVRYEITKPSTVPNTVKSVDWILISCTYFQMQVMSVAQAENPRTRCQH
jgi:hypothetical protein